MNPFIPAEEQENVLEHIASFAESVRQLLDNDEIDAQSRHEVHDLLSFLESSTKEAMQEVDKIIAEAEARTAALRSTLQARKRERPATVTPPEPKSAVPEVVDPAMGYRLGNELLTKFGYLSPQTIASTQALRTIHDWIEESVFLASSPPQGQASRKPLPEDRGAHVPDPTAVKSAPSAPSIRRSHAHIDLGWTAWLRSSGASVPGDSKDEKGSTSREDVWRDVFH